MSMDDFGVANQNSTWLHSRGIWVTYFLGLLLLHLILLSIPIVTIPIAWTVTNVLHNAVHLVFLHSLKGTPWHSLDQGANRGLTHWEQIDCGQQFTLTKKFLVIVPIVLFLLACCYTKNDSKHFVVNFTSLILVELPKLPQFHKVRLCGINKY